VLQIALVELAIISVLATLTRSRPVAMGAIVVGSVALVVILGRQKGQWWPLRRVMAARYRRRRRAGRVVHADARLAALRWLAPGLTVHMSDAPDGAQIAVARDDAGWYAIAAVAPSASATGAEGLNLPLAALVSALVEAEQPAAVLQLVTHTVPAPSVGLDPKSLASRSYRELMQQCGRIPAQQTSWVSVRVDDRALAEAGARCAEDAAQAPAAVAALIRRMIKVLRRHGMSAHPLDLDGVLAALLHSCDLDPAEGTPRTQEKWRSWLSGRMAHRVYWVRDWPEVTKFGGRLLSALVNTPATATTVALIAVPDDDLVDVRCLVRVAARAQDLGRVCSALTKAARGCRADLSPLDGEQAPAVYATAPTGGGPR
jgi:type VII secretion protein EccE